MPLYAGCHGTDAASLGGAIAAAGGRTLLVFKVCEPRRGTIDPSLRCSANALVLPVSQLERTIQFSLGGWEWHGSISMSVTAEKHPRGTALQPASRVNPDLRAVEP